MMKRTPPTGVKAERLRHRKEQLLRQLRIPANGLPGSLALTHSRCGKAACHCVKGTGHPGWSLTFMCSGKKRVERLPAEWADEVRRQVEEGRKFKATLAEIFNANVQVLVLERQQQRSKKR